MGDTPNHINFFVRGTDDPTLIFVHGFGCSLHDWEGQFRDLSPSFRCVALDLPGHGHSAKPETISIETMGTAVNRVKDRIAARSTILVGHSMGCRVITDAFQQSDATVSGLVFVDGSILGSDLESTMKSTKAAIDRAGMDAFTHQFFSEKLPDELAAGEAYIANELSALMWVHATLVDTAVAAYELVMPTLSPEVRERYYADCRFLGALFGIPVEAQPGNWPAFRTWFDETIASDRLSVVSAAKTVGGEVLSGAGRIPVPRWYLDVTASLMPERLRAAFDLRFGNSAQRRARRAVAVLRYAYPILPGRVRHVGPYQEALARTAGRGRPDLLTRSLNLFWIGRSSMREE